MSDEHFIHMTLDLAAKARGNTFPNPMVGCVIVKTGKIISKGFHRRAGGHHAEIEALNAAKENVAGATLYVNLEPCSHFGKTPPCVDAIIKAGIKHVVCSTLDPHKKVFGEGIKRLKAAGIKVSVGLQEVEARKLNASFFTFHEKKRPLVALKFASSLDGKMATRTGDSKWITNDEARKFARNLRGEFQAILVGINTVLTDDPHLGVRNSKRNDPVRIILDSKLQIPLNAQVLRDKNVLIATTVSGSKQKKKLLEKRGIELHIFKGKQVPLKELMKALTKRNIVSVFVEGGSETIGSFIDQKLVDKVYAFYSPILIGGAKSLSIGGEGVKNVSEALSFKIDEIKRFGDNFLAVSSRK